MTLPSSALLFRAEGLQVGVVNDRGVVELRKVELGRDFGPRVEILSGVTATDKVIAAPFDSLVSGQTVHVNAPPPPPSAANAKVKPPTET
jgi:multidrug efflux pump subunit AcrA (membrane-fusion protein)